MGIWTWLYDLDTRMGQRDRNESGEAHLRRLLRKRTWRFSYQREVLMSVQDMLRDIDRERAARSTDGSRET